MARGLQAPLPMSPRRDPLRVEAPAPVRSDPSVLRNVLWKFGIPLLVAFGAATYLAIPVAERVLTEWFQADVDMRAQLVFNSIEEGLEPLIETNSEPQIRRYLARITMTAGSSRRMRAGGKSCTVRTGSRKRSNAPRRRPASRPSSWCKARRGCCTSPAFRWRSSRPKATAWSSCTTWASSIGASRVRATTWSHSWPFPAQWCCCSACSLRGPCCADGLSRS